MNKIKNAYRLWKNIIRLGINEFKIGTTMIKEAKEEAEVMKSNKKSGENKDNP